MAKETKTYCGMRKQKHNLLFIPVFDAWLVEDLDSIPGRTGICLQGIFQQGEFFDTLGTSQRFNHQAV